MIAHQVDGKCDGGGGTVHASIRMWEEGWGDCGVVDDKGIFIVHTDIADVIPGPSDSNLSWVDELLDTLKDWRFYGKTVEVGE